MPLKKILSLVSVLIVWIYLSTEVQFFTTEFFTNKHCVDESR